MKHSVKITIILLAMFFLAQLIGIVVIDLYEPEVTQVIDNSGNIINKTSHNLPYQLEPPQTINPYQFLIQIIIAIILAVFAMFFLMKYGANLFLRIWFFAVIILALGIAINAFLLDIQYSSIIALIIAVPLAIFKVFKRNFIIHNATELLVYPGIAAIFVPLLNIWTICVILVLISIYDMYAVWHSGHMQKMAKYQITKLKIFSGFFIPYLGKKERELVNNAKRSKKVNDKKIKISVAILGGGDVVFPIMLAGVVLRTLGMYQALIIAVGATIALACLFYISEKGKFYPAMPFISVGCFAALGIAYLI